MVYILRFCMLKCFCKLNRPKGSRKHLVCNDIRQDSRNTRNHFKFQDFYPNKEDNSLFYLGNSIFLFGGVCQLWVDCVHSFLFGGFYGY